MLEALKNAGKAESKKLKEMNFKEKREYIWEYYKVPIIGVIIGLLVGYSIIYNVYINPPKTPFVNIAFYGEYVPDEYIEKINNTLTESVVEDKENYQVFTHHFMINEEDPEVTMAMMQKFMAMIAANEIDIILTGEIDFEGFLYEAYLLSMDGLDTEKYTESLVSGVSKEIAGELPYGIALKGNSYFEELGFKTDDLYLGIAINTKKIENVAEVINFIMK